MAKPSLQIVAVYGADDAMAPDMIRPGDLLFEYAGVPLLGDESLAALKSIVEASEALPKLVVRVLRSGEVIELLIPGRGLCFDVQDLRATPTGEAFAVRVVQLGASENLEELPQKQATSTVSASKPAVSENAALLKQLTLKRKLEQLRKRPESTPPEFNPAESESGSSAKKEWDDLSAKEKATGIGLLVFMAFSAFATMVSDDSARPAHSKSLAHYECQRYVKRELLAPATADFASYGETRVLHHRDGMYSVGSYVDADNVFGAKIRTQYRCVIEYERGTWVLQSLEM